MRFSDSLKKNDDFKNVYKKGKSYANKYLVMYVLKNNKEVNRIDLSILQTAKRPPFKAPYFSTASKPYSEQVGI